jgi:hypothetical protein
MGATNADQSIWSDSVPFYWVVICKNNRQHHRVSRYYSHVIPLGETDGLEPLPKLSAEFVVRCDECGETFHYKPAEVLRYQLDLPEKLTPHEEFR